MKKYQLIFEKSSIITIYTKIKMLNVAFFLSYQSIFIQKLIWMNKNKDRYGWINGYESYH